MGQEGSGFHPTSPTLAMQDHEMNTIMAKVE
jgi:hypothetical protein